MSENEEKTQRQAQDFANRLSKRYRHLKKWAKRRGVTSFRLYDRDIPEIPLAVDLYEKYTVRDTVSNIIGAPLQNADLSAQNATQATTDGETDGVYTAHNTVLNGVHNTDNGAPVPLSKAATSAHPNPIHDAQNDVIHSRARSNSESAPLAQSTQTDTDSLYLHIALYERPYQKDEAEEDAWLSAMKHSAARALGIPDSNVITKQRKKQRGESAQYEKLGDTKLCFPINEQGVLFTVNLSDYLDTGIFFDHRPLRGTVRDTARGKHVLNLFCYTASFSLYAALGGAASVDSVDLSNTYLQWAKNNFLLNGIDITQKIATQDGTAHTDKYRFIAEDVTSFVHGAAHAKKALRNRWDIIILDPPTFSNSKRMKNVFDINSCWSELCDTCLSLLTRGGVLYFSTNSQMLKFDQKFLPRAFCTDITAGTIDEDFTGKKSHRAWKIVPRD